VVSWQVFQDCCCSATRFPATPGETAGQPSEDAALAL